MRTAEIRDLTAEAFSRYGSFVNMINPTAEKIGEEPIEFYRDMMPLDVGSSSPSFSICRLTDRPPTVDITEFHNTTEEGILPLDADVLIHVAPATAETVPPIDQIEIFRVPRGTFVRLRKGVWHHAPFVVDKKEANVLIVLSERIYATDCEVREIPKRDQVSIAR